MEDRKKELWVLIETDEDGSARNVGLELLEPGRRLADRQGRKLTGIVIGDHCSQAIRQAESCGADKIICVEGSEYSHYTTDAYVNALYRLVEKYQPEALLIGATGNGRDLAPRLSCRLKTGLTADCTSLDIDEESGHVAWTRPAFGGNLMATILCPTHRPQIGTVRPGVFHMAEPDQSRRAVIIREDIHIPQEEIRTKVLKVIEEAGLEAVDLESAKVIVAGGRGVGGPDGFAMLEELAKVLDGVVGASRACVDAGWIGHAHQVGQTGKTVSPEIYIACGISGAIQHQAGMSGSDVIIAVNKDASAPIFRIADYGVIGDLKAVIPVLTEELKKIKQTQEVLK